ncbi:hypothetical protein HMPREF9542_02606, partial [Escherichia coli MS 117-3]
KKKKKKKKKRGRKKPPPPPGTYKRLNQTFALGQMPFNIIKQGILAPCPLQKSAIFLHAD